MEEYDELTPDYRIEEIVAERAATQAALPEEGKQKRKGKGRPTHDIDPETVLKLARLGCSTTDIGRWFGVNESTIRTAFGELISKAKVETRSHIRRAQINLALSGNPTMLIWLGKQMLNQGENGPTDDDDNKPLPWID